MRNTNTQFYNSADRLIKQNNMFEDENIYEDPSKKLKSVKSVPLINCKPENDPFYKTIEKYLYAKSFIQNDKINESVVFSSNLNNSSETILKNSDKITQKKNNQLDNEINLQINS